MAHSAWRLSLRDYFWLTLLVAIGIGWGLERYRAANETKRVPSEWVPSRESTSYENRRRPILARLRALTDSELVAEFQSQRSDKDEYSCILCEMARRNLHDELKLEFDKVDQGIPRRSIEGDLEFLTVLRRAQGKPDPIKIHIEVNAPTRLVASVENVDVDQEGFFYVSGGDDRSGRHTKWQVQLIDEKGVRVGDSNYDLLHVFLRGGGLGSIEILKYGQKDGWPKHLDIRKYVTPPATGIYTLRVFHSDEDIAGEGDLDGLIVWQSNPIRVRVTNRVPSEGRGLSPLVFGGILIASCILWGVSAAWRLFQAENNASPSVPVLTWRDVIAVLLLITITATWQFDSWRLSPKFQGVRADDAANWSIEPMD